ncbi:MAG: deoxyribodipyrimidine photo-lyase [Candidatus Bipolaricaulaceae bacterium]
MEAERIRRLNSAPLRTARYVLYWMQTAQRAAENPALEFALALAREHKLPVVVAFGLGLRSPEANLRRYVFLLEGLFQVAAALKDRGIRFSLRTGELSQEFLTLAREAACAVMDGAYLRPQRAWQAEVAQRAPCTVFQVDTEVVVPVELAYPREAVNAAVLRRRIHPLLSRFLRALPEQDPPRSSLPLELPGREETLSLRVLEALPVDRSVPPVELPAGTEAARRRLARFVEEKLTRYHEDRNDPSKDGTSGLSPYLHFGQISPVEVARRVAEVGGPGAEAFLEELVVRRELAFNFVVYNPQYDAFAGLPRWAQETLRRHAQDPRSALYTLEELEEGRTHDPLWNAAQAELRAAGKIHGYLRMYWGKQFLRWTHDPEDAFRWALYLNNKYALDGNDPASYAGVGWCFGLHDRPFPERPLWGKVRPMTGAGLRGKRGPRVYIARWTQGGSR